MIDVWRTTLGFTATLAQDAVHTGAGAVGAIPHGGGFFFLALLLPALSVVLCGVYAALGVKSKLPAWTTVVCLTLAFITILVGYIQLGPDSPRIAFGFHWFNLSWGSAPGQSLVADFALYIDGLSLLWMLFVTGLGALIALYSSEYMAGDKGYARYFAAFSLFVFTMSCLVLGDNLLFMFLGWEGVGLCSYLLIGHNYKKPSAVAAAKKAFIVNRIGDFGLIVGLMLTFVKFGALRYEDIFAQVDAMRASGVDIPMSIKVIPLLFMAGAFGKSAQLPLYVWLPDAMEGPTPVSALIHAATMVTAGVYLIARTMPLFTLNPDALATVAWVGGLTALFSATIGMAVFDIKRVMAYSTVSQLGYMFLGLGALSASGAAYHVFTHAFFKASLFLSCGAVMHGFAGQLDLRKLSGLAKLPGWRITAFTMLVGCLCLSGFPFTSGFFSKDMIIAEAFVTPGPGYQALGIIALITAGMTAYYAFRVFFRVFLGPVEFEPGEEYTPGEHAHDDHAVDDGQDTTAHASFHPHAPGVAINLVLTLLAIGALAAAAPYFMHKEHGGWVGAMTHGSTAAIAEESQTIFTAHTGAGAVEHVADEETLSILGMTVPHVAMYFISSGFAIVGLALAWVLHMTGRRSAASAPVADALKRALGPVGVWAEHKWYVDELYDWLLRKPLRVLAWIFAYIDMLFVDGLVSLAGVGPRILGWIIRPSQSGALQGYAAGMAAGMILFLLMLWVML